MLNKTHLDGAGLLSWATRAAELLTLRCAEINALNVFPVPDADTGSNMAHTMEAAVAEVAKQGLSEQDGVASIAGALAAGSVRGARGNSGVVLSQMLCGVAQAAAGGDLDGAAVVDALNFALDMVLKAIKEPVDGTVVTVMRATVVSINALDETAIESVVAEALQAARAALMLTPSQLPALREAGVVDAGGQGFVVLLEALADVVFDNLTRPTGTTAPNVPKPLTTTARSNELEVMFFFTGDRLDELEERLGGMGDSLVVARTVPQLGLGEATPSAQVHIHSNQAGAVIELAYGMGAVSDLRLEVLPLTPGATAKRRLVLAIAPAGPIADLYEEAGAEVVVPGDSDVVSDIIAAVRKAEAEEVILLPNGMLAYGELVNAELASHAVAASMNILPTARLVSGIAALAVHDPAQPLAADTYAMAEAAGSTRTALLQRTPRAMITQAGRADAGDIIASSGVEILYVSHDLQAALETTVLRLLQSGGELVTLLVTAEAAREISAQELRYAIGIDSAVEVTVYPAEGIEHLIEIGVE
ncbi:DAK2 domain-containing protein [Corynebacterium epidermidicanis]|uniref:Putative kinase, dihydroxyacetone kinase n=1 Tax=Corynebacterium epidermidicanis TaxID=1050174 RepID=A0A0G3GTV9_9CORY|nr:DAK2 domain-containing protein [Corynebacterium epidermidicanis]AKK02983.1 putative kinase, dihydroxyacetone kinase [Corynebacterium epidermidicanis]